MPLYFSQFTYQFSFSFSLSFTLSLPLFLSTPHPPTAKNIDHVFNLFIAENSNDHTE